MELTVLEQKSIIRIREWMAWLEKETPIAFRSSIDESQLELLIHSLNHYEERNGASRNLYHGGVFIVAPNESTIFSEQLERLIRYDIHKIYMFTVKGDTPTGAKEMIVAHLKFGNGALVSPVGFSDSAKEGHVKKALVKAKIIDPENYEQLIKNFDQSFLDYGDVGHIVKNIKLFQSALDDINVKAELQEEGSDDGQICIAMANKRSTRTGFFFHLLKIFEHYQFEVRKVQTVYIPHGEYDEKILTHFYINGDINKLTKRNKTELNRLLEAISVNQWFEAENPMNRTLFHKLGFSIHHTIFLSAVQQFVHQMLVQVDPNLYNMAHVNDAFKNYPTVSRNIVNYFSYKFRPIAVAKGLTEEVRDNLEKSIEGIDSGIENTDLRNKTILTLAVNMVDKILKTNYYVIRRSALSIKIDPSILDDVPFADREALFPEIPNAIFYIKGKNFIAFSIRFRELSRGGVRTLIPRSWDQFRHQQQTVFHECYHLAYTQQKKNKDIPEGGAKSIIFLKPNFGLERELELEKNNLEKSHHSKENLSDLLAERKNTLVRRHLFDAQKSFCDTLLDILIWDRKNDRLEYECIRDYYGKEEWVCLGPDENMTNQMIEWISSRSAERNYSVGTAFMSGKKDQGINHKEFGVTSLGVHQYLKEALKSKVSQKSQFEVKITGGPDGDVAGNEILNLINDYGANVKITCIQDGTGVLYDPAGINQKELVKLFENVEGISAINTNLLHENAFLVKVHEKRQKKAGIEEVLMVTKAKVKGKLSIQNKWIGASEANRLYHSFLHGLKADAFIPCGGRPRSLKESNWESFLLEDGSASAPVIVEGANLYLSDGARRCLEEKNVLIIKDASANKCGVICSSYEIMAGLLLSPEEFTKLKNTFVKEIKQLLKVKANKEAKILVNAFINEDKSTIEQTDLVSRRINQYGDLIRSQLPEIRKSRQSAAMIKAALEAHIPKSLLKVAMNRLKKLPDFYQDAIVACSLASNLIYKHGVDYQPSIVDSLTVEVKKGLLK